MERAEASRTRALTYIRLYREYLQYRFQAHTVTEHLPQTFDVPRRAAIASLETIATVYVNVCSRGGG